MKIDKNLNHRNRFDPNMKINIVDFVPKKIAGNKVYINDPGKSIPFGRKIKNFDGDIVDINLSKRFEKNIDAEVSKIEKNFNFEIKDHALELLG